MLLAENAGRGNLLVSGHRRCEMSDLMHTFDRRKGIELGNAFGKQR